MCNAVLVLLTLRKSSKNYTNARENASHFQSFRFLYKEQPLLVTSPQMLTHFRDLIRKVYSVIVLYKKYDEEATLFEA